MRCPSLTELPPSTTSRKGWPWTKECVQLPENSPDGSHWPRISIVTPSYNQGHFIEETIRSVLLQGYPKLEYIIIDGGSKDETIDIIQKYEYWISHWISEADNGQADAVNKGWKIATGKILGWLNSDDRYEPGALKRIAKAFQESPEVKVIYGDCQVIDRRSHPIHHKRLADYSLDRLLAGEQMGQPAVFMNRDAATKVNYLNQDLDFALDTDFFLRMWLEYPAASFRYIPEIFASSRVYDETKTRTGLDKITKERRMVLERILSNPSWRPKVESKRRKIIGYTYRYEAQMFLKTGNKLRALRSLIQAWWFNPANYTIRGIKYILQKSGLIKV